ncbi:TIGR00341 family protein [Halobacteriales archaeon Cl-PHB]
MRLVQVTIPRGKRESILSALDDEELDYVVTDETSGRDYDAIAHVPLPTNAVEPVLETLREAGLDDEAFTVVVDANTVISRRFERLQERYSEDDDADQRIAREELVAAASDLAPTTWTYIAMTVVSAVIATAGLLLDSPAVVVGSMVIAPLIGPAMAASVGTVVNDTDLFRRGVRLQISGLLVAILSATVFGLFIRYAHLIPPLPDVFEVQQISERVAPDALSLIVALGSGVAGVVALTSGISTALVGVMIAVALIPPAATVGIGLAWQSPLVALGSGVLLLVNVLSINLAAIIVLWYTGYRPEHWFRKDQARSATVKRVAVLMAAIVALSVFLGGVTYDTYNQAVTEEDIRSEVDAVVASLDASVSFEVRLLNVEVVHTNTALFRKADRVVVHIGIPPGEAYAGLAERLDARVDAVVGHDVDTQIRYVTTEQA